ncbi:hypothetical protein DOY81_011533 [Sarcophaga bullata]|nr:hypothetical protein DOY81_011533 [Sarcophaga bullata]
MSWDRVRTTLFTFNMLSSNGNLLTPFATSSSSSSPSSSSTSLQEQKERKEILFFFYRKVHMYTFRRNANKKRLLPQICSHDSYVLQQ